MSTDGRAFIRCKPSSPCRICETSDERCSVADDGSVRVCYRQGGPGAVEKRDKAGNIYYVHKGDSTEAIDRQADRKPAKPRQARASANDLHAGYEALLGRLSLSDAHRKALASRGFPKGEADRLGYKTMPSRGRAEIALEILKELGKALFLKIPGFYINDRGEPSIAALPGMVIPCRDAKGRIIGLNVRPDKVLDTGNKYLWVSSAKYDGPSPGAPVHVPFGLKFPARTIRLTEGLLKADLASACSPVPTLGCPGVGNWAPALPITRTLGADTIRLSFDADWRSKPQVGAALRDCALAIIESGFALELELWDEADGKGIDDVLTAGKTPKVLAGDDAKRAIGLCITPQRPEILITTEEHEAISQAVDAVALDPSVFQRTNTLVTILRDKAKGKKRGPDRPFGTPRIVPIPLPRLREILSLRARWMKSVKSKSGGTRQVAAHPADWAVAGVAARGEWPQVRNLEGIVEAPTMRLDGTILDTPGWDEETGLLYEPNCQYPPIPASPSRDDARLAADLLFDLVADFPFSGDAHKAAWLASLLTVLARFAIDGACPLFLFDANTSGAGKGKLCHLVAIIATGRPMACADYPDREDEMAKQITAIALAADLMVLFDNVETGAPIGGKSLDRALTAPSIKGRILGRSQMTGDLPMNTVFFATGNNVGQKGDALRRILPSRLNSPEARPEERKDFRVKGDILAHALGRRGELVAAALTILRAYVVAGRPQQDLTPMDYIAWCGLVRNAIHWATSVDPAATRADLIADDPETNGLETLVAGWKDLCSAENRDSLTAAEAVKALEQTEVLHAPLKGVLTEWSRDGKLPTPRLIGNRFNKLRGKVTVAGSLDFHTSRGNRSWYVKPPKNADRGGSGGSGDSLLHPSREKQSPNERIHTEGNGVIVSHHSHHSHHNGSLWRADDPTLPAF